ncbi:MAG: SHD1 domain-containing protein [Thermoguttaceae bacterium]
MTSLARTRYSRVLFCCLFAVITLGAVAAASGEILYAVVVSKETHADSNWKAVVDALVAKHQATVVEYEGDVNETLPELRKLMPRYACFVAKPEDAGRLFVIGIHRMARKLNSDPYTDLMWGIITGYTPEDALRIAKTEKPLIIRKLAGGIVIGMDPFDEAICYKESSKNEYVEKKPGGQPETKTGNGDDAFPLADIINTRKPDMFVTSGHATERDWQIGYPAGNEKGMFWRQEGKLLAIAKDHKQAKLISSENPKVLLAAGNCLMGHCIDRDAICLAWMHTAGVTQMIGYTVNQWYPAAGFGTLDYFLSESGRYTLNEAFYLNNQKIVYDLDTRFPKSARMGFTEWDLAKDRGILGRMVPKLGYTNPKPEDKDRIKDNLGLLWDRDTLAFYGDPAWEARLAPRDLPFSKELVINGNEYTFRITANADCAPGREPGMILPQRIKGIEVTKGQELSPLVTANFVMLMKPGKFQKGKTYEVVFKAEPIDPSAPVLKTSTGTVTNAAASAAPAVSQSGESADRSAVRVWTDQTGQHKTRAKLLSVENGAVKLQKENGAVITVPIAKLSEADQQFLGSAK